MTDKTLTEDEANKLSSELFNAQWGVPYQYRYQQHGIFPAVEEEFLTVGAFTLKGLPLGTMEAMAWQPPEALKRLEANAIMAHRGTDNPLEQLMEEVVSSYRLKRLTKETKEALLDWIYDGCFRYGRDRYEKATLVPVLLQGFNSTGRERGPYVPTLGSINTASRVLDGARRVFTNLAYMQGIDAPRETTSEVMVAAGADQSIFAKLEVAEAITAYADRKVIVRHMESNVGQIGQYFDCDTVSTSALPQGKLSYYTPAVQWYRLCQPLRDITNDALEALVDDIIRQFVRRQKRKGKG